MKYTVHLTQRVQRDIESAADYIEFTLLNAKDADELITAAEETLAGLSDMPQRHMIVSDEVLAAWGIRFIQVKKYLAFYIIDEKEHIVHVVRFLYGKRNWRAVLRQDAETGELLYS